MYNIAWTDPARELLFQAWLANIAPRHGLNTATLQVASADASFRRYLRIFDTQGRSYIIMDSPPQQLDVRPFVKVAGMLHAAQLNAPAVLEQEVEHGFLLLSDLGNETYLDAFKNSSFEQADRLMRAAITALVQWQVKADASGLPTFDEAFLRREMDLFPQWCVQAQWGIQWGEREQKYWASVTAALVQSALAQPQLAMHRDYMARNLMHCETDSPGILDFQDAVCGPISYDMASLLRDAFWSWEEHQELDWAVRYWEQARAAGLPVHDDFGEFWRALEWMGLQRHLKIMGLFCRLKIRDGKAQYFEDLPRFFSYANRVAMRYGPLKPLVRLLEPLSGTALSTALTF